MRDCFCSAHIQYKFNIVVTKAYTEIKNELNRHNKCRSKNFNRL